MAFNFENYITPITTGPNSPLNSSNITATIGLANTTGTPEILYTRITFFLTWGMSIVAILVLIYGGFLYITAGGEAEKAEKGKKAIIGAVIGIIVIMISYTVFNVSIGALKKSGEGSLQTDQQIREQLNVLPEDVPKQTVGP